MTSYNIGDQVFAKVTKYRPAEDIRFVHEITPDTPVWVTGAFTLNPNFDIHHEVVVLMPPTLTDERLQELDWDGDVGLSNHCDRWVLVPYDDLPDEVITAFTRMKLLGEIE